MNKHEGIEIATPLADNEEQLNQGVSMKRFSIITLLLLLSSGCVVAGGYSSDGGWFIWPGTLGILVVAAVLFLLLRRR
jgi:hypothetical protein